MSAKLTRCLRLLRHFEQHTTLANRDVRELMDCDFQTASRDIKSLIDAGVPIEVQGQGSETHYVLSESHRGWVFSVGDALSLHFGRKLLSFVDGTLFPDWMDELREKLDRNAQQLTTSRASVFSQRLVYISEPYRPYKTHDKVLDCILRGLLDERELHVDYQSRTGARTYVLRPLALVIYRRALYLFAERADGAGYRRLPIDRFVNVRSGDRFCYPQIDVDGLLQTTFGIFDDQQAPEAVRLRFSPEVADLVQARQWHPTQSFEACDDGGVVLCMTTHGPELGRMVLEWGPMVEVLAPQSLRERVQDELKATLALYRSDPAS